LPVKSVNIHQAKTQLSRLVEAASEGEEVVLARAGKPVAKIVPIRKHAGKRKPGALKGRIKFGRGWDRPLTKREIAAWVEAPLFPPPK
jgi:prevent-host-death family protein